MQAYMYGFFKNKRIVLYDTLIQQVNWNVVEIFDHMRAFRLLNLSSRTFYSMFYYFITYRGSFNYLAHNTFIFSILFISAKMTRKLLLL